MHMIFGGWIGASSLASSIGTRSGGIESGKIDPHGSLARGGVPSREEITSPFSVVSTKPWCTRFDNWKRQYFIWGKPIYRMFLYLIQATPTVARTRPITNAIFEASAKGK